MDFEDEVDAVEDVIASPPAAVWTAPTPLKNVQSSSFRALSFIDPLEFRYEMLGLVGLLVYVALHYFGRRVNGKIARDWLQCTMSVWEKNFARVGDDKGVHLIRDSAIDYYFTCSGRAHVQSCIGYVKLIPRYDLFHIAQSMANVVPLPKWDEVKIVVTLKPEIEGSILALFPRSQSVRLLKERYDLSDLTSTASIPALKNLVLRTDAPEMALALFEDSEFLDQLDIVNSCDSQMLLSIIVTDQADTLPATISELEVVPKVLTAIFKMPASPSVEQEKVHAALVRMIFIMVDHYALPFSGASREKLAKLRDGVQERIMKKAEEARKLELSKLKAKKEKELAETLDAKSLAKLESKQAKKQMRKGAKMGRVVM